MILAWMLGHWVGGTGDETWVRVGGRLWGFGFPRDGAFEVMRIEPDAGGIRFVASPGGRGETPFARTVEGRRSATFTNAAHDFPQQVAYARRGRRLTATIGNVGEPVAMTFRFERGDPAPLPAVEAADRAFALDSAARGAAAWVDAWDPDGFLWTDRAVGREGLAEVLPKDVAALRWEPAASGVAASGDLGFTVGPWQKGEARGTYATIWRRQADGSWKVLFDMGVEDP